MKLSPFKFTQREGFVLLEFVFSRNISEYPRFVPFLVVALEPLADMLQAVSIRGVLLFGFAENPDFWSGASEQEKKKIHI